jgi:hypothetical protein
MARPKKPILKSKVVSVHMTRAEHLMIKGLAKKCKLPLSQYLLNTGLQINLKPKFTENEIALYRQLVALSNNVNQIAKQLNERKILGIDALEDLDKIREVINKFR